MTKFEKNQKPEVFVNAGRNAFALEIPGSRETPGVRVTCIYSSDKARKLWTAGYKIAAKEAQYRRSVISNAEARA